MPRLLTDPTREQTERLVQVLGRAAQSTLISHGAGGLAFAMVFWTRDTPVTEDRIILSAAPDTDTSELYDALRAVLDVLDRQQEGK